jgi:hypothetical protein
MTVMSHGVILFLLLIVAASPFPDRRAEAFGEGGARRAEALREGAAQLQSAPARPPARPQPRIDPLTASIHGRVTTADSGAPIRRAEVRAMNDGGISRLVTTDGDGRFELRDLPAGKFRVTVSKSGFVPLSYGQRRPFEAPRVIDLAEGQRITMSMALPRGGAIAGRVYDEAGEPIAEVRVQALRSRMVEGQRRLQPAGAVDVTDDTGAFRLYGLAPGDYYVSAVPPSVDMGDMRARLTPGARATTVKTPTMTFHPGTASFAEAQRVTLGVGGEVRADVQLGTSTAANVSGIVLSSTGAPAADAGISLRSEAVAMGAGGMGGSSPLMIGAHTDVDGTFTLSGIPPGPYTLQATLQDFATTPGPLAGIELARMPVTVGGADITGLTVVTGPGGTIEGSFVADSGVVRSLPTGLRVSMQTLSPGGPSMMNMSGNNTFRLMGANGAVHLVVGELPDDWTVKAIMVDGVDMIDKPIDMKGGRASNVRIVLTDRITEVIGTIADTSAATADDTLNHTVVIFAEDASKWTYPSRYLRTVRTDDTGGFTVRGLPPNERYLAAAVDYLEDGEGSDPEFLERIRDRATSFLLADGERRAVALRLIRR